MGGRRIHTIQHKRNFIGCINKLIQEVNIDARAAFDQTITEFKIKNRVKRIGVFPISIDYDEFLFAARDKRVKQRSVAIRNNAPDAKIILGVDRLDYTKGIPEKLRAFKRFLTRFPEFHKKACFIQVVVPSRRGILAYKDLKLEIEQLVGEINGVFNTHDWLPIRYMFRSLDRKELVALYRASDIAFVTPLKDGMNLVAKEYCTCNVDETGVLILSEFAGAAQQFYTDALLVNPHDTDKTADAILRAFEMSDREKAARMHNLREDVRTRDVMWWLNSFVTAAVRKELKGFSEPDEYFPRKPENRGGDRERVNARNV
ncbi:MAG: trehalose-6-phosphate synthase [Desulfobacter sp.]|nr:trehalose-6-phosphate synthase [Desulfobacter sp.]